MGVTSASLQAQFSAAGAVDPAAPDALASTPGRVPLQWAYHTGVSYGGRVPLRLYPSLGGGSGSVGTGGAAPGALFTAATNGRLIAKGFGVEDVEDELLTFQGSDRARTRFPVEVLNRATFTGSVYAVEDEERFVSVTPRLRSDPVSGEILADRPFYGAALVSYKTSYRRFDFEHDSQASPLPGFVGGRVLASFAGSIATMDISTGDPDGSATYFLVAWVTSEYLGVAEDAAPDGEAGAWEKPSGWPDTAGWPGQGEIDRAGAVLQERIHATVAVNSLGALSVRHNRTPSWKKPFETDTSFNPVYRLVFNSRDLPPRVTVDSTRIREALLPYYDGI